VSTIQPWIDLLAAAEREHELALAGRWDDVAEATAARTRTAMALGAAPPQAAPVLERLAVVQDELTTLLLEARSATVAELAGLRHGRGAVRGYATAGVPAERGGWVNDRG
jgi:hypothetical protein